VYEVHHADQGIANVAELEDALAEATTSRGAADERLYETRSGDFTYDTVALGDEPYRATDAELAKLPPKMRARLLAQRERSPRRWAARDAMYARDLAGLQAWTRQQNRAAALRTVEQDGLTRYFTQCACGWCGLRVDDPELARREYDAHACRIEGDAHIDRAVASVDREQHDAAGKLIVAKRQPHEMQVAWSAIVESAAVEMRKYTDDTEARYALLELK